MSKLELYGIVLAIVLLSIGGAYFKGRLDEHRSITTQQLAANASDMTKYQTALETRAAADDASRQKAADFIASVDQGIARVNAKFANVPTVVVDAHGCPALTDNARLRWNSVELLPAGPVANTAASASAAVPASPVPTP
jgi:hypothetical protein